MRSQLTFLTPLVFLVISALGTVLPANDDGLSVEGSSRCPKPLVRKEWSVSLRLLLSCLIITRRTLSRKEKKSYISAIHCLASKPNVIPKEVAPGAVSLYDSFVATHVIEFPDIHLTVGIFLLSLGIAGLLSSNPGALLAVAPRVRRAR